MSSHSLFDRKSRRRKRIIAGLITSVSAETNALLTKLQNEISIGYNSKIIGIGTVNDDILAASFAIGFAQTYGNNGENCLIVDANFYNPALFDCANIEAEDGRDYNVMAYNDCISMVELGKEIYPSEVLKRGIVHKIVKDNASKFHHILILLPTFYEHREASLLKDILGSVVMVVQKDVTRKARIFESCQFLANDEIPLSKVVILS